MRRFNEVLLLALCTLLPSSLAKGLQSPHQAVKHDALRKPGAVIRGLLDARYYYCSYNYYQCSATTCCPGGWPCCADGNCCDPSSYCILGTNGVGGCCPNGQLCYGPVGDPNTIYPTPAPTATTHHSTTNDLTTTSTPTTTFTTLVGVPTQISGDQIIEVSVLDVNITWSQNWVQTTSLCGPSITSKSTSTENSSFTYIFQYPVYQTPGYHYYFNVVNYNTKWEVFINGFSQQRFDSFTTVNCTYLELFMDASDSFSSFTQNMTVVVHGADSSDVPGPWSLEFNKLLIQEKNLSLKSTTSGGFGPTGLPLSAAGRTEPYRPLLVFGGILLLILYWA